MTTNRNRAAEVIRKAYREAFFQIENQMDWAPFAAAALEDAGLLAPDLPAKDEWDDVILIPREGKTTVVKDVFTDTSYSITGARMHALDLLAAADHAEKAAAHAQKEETNE